MVRTATALAGWIALAACTAAGVPVAAPALSLPHLAHPEAGVYTAGRIGAADVAPLRAAGVRQVIDLTMPAESPGFDEGAALAPAGIAYDNLPISGAEGLTRDNVAAFDALLRGAARPVLVHCASSNRAGALAALRAAWIEGMPVDAALAKGRAWGMTTLEDAVRERLEAGR